MVELKKKIYELLSTVITTYDDTNVPQDAALPYCTYTLPINVKNYQRDIIALKVTIWDENTDARDIENLADGVDHLLDRYKYYKNGVLQTSIYRIARSEIPDPEPNILRRELQFDCKTYFG
jgi:hypothetical protein